jgi:PHD/YefM family antitoxin component YafN of YafNO toxin-antitoxin module
MPSTLPTSPSGVHEFRQNLTKLLKRVRREGDFPVQFVGAYRRIEGVFMSPHRYEQLLETENLVEDIGLAELAAQRDDGRFHEGTTEDFLAEVEQRAT